MMAPRQPRIGFFMGGDPSDERGGAGLVKMLDLLAICGNRKGGL